MNIRRLQYFISVAKNLNFTKAAGECYVAETVISRNIAVLEEEVGFKVFKRNNRRVELTQAGEVFYKQAKSIIERYETAVRDCQDIASKNKNVLNMSFISLFERGVISETLKGFTEDYPDIYLRIKQSTYNLIIEDIKNEEVDIAFFSPPYIIEPLSGVEIKRVFEEPYCIVMPQNHELASHKTLSLRMIANENIILNYPDWEIPNISERNKKYCRDFGFKEENIIPCYGGVEAALLMVELNKGIHLIASSMKNLLEGMLVYADADESFAKCEVVVAYSSFNKKKSVISFLDYVNTQNPNLQSKT